MSNILTLANEFKIDKNGRKKRWTILSGPSPANSKQQKFT